MSIIIPTDRTPARDLTLVGECPECRMPGLHKMPRRVLICKVDESVVHEAREWYHEVKRNYHRSYGGGYDYREATSSERHWLEQARTTYHAALRSAERYLYLLLRECHSCDHQWFELIREFRSDAEAVTLRNRYPEGLVVFEGS